MSHVTCHVSCVTFFFLSFFMKVVELVGGGYVIMVAYPSSCHLLCLSWCMQNYLIRFCREDTLKKKCKCIYKKVKFSWSLIHSNLLMNIFQKCTKKLCKLFHIICCTEMCGFQDFAACPSKSLLGGSPFPNRHIRLDNLAWSHSVFIQFSLCIKRRLMKPLLLSSITNYTLFNPLPPKIYVNWNNTLFIYKPSKMNTSPILQVQHF